MINIFYSFCLLLMPVAFHLSIADVTQQFYLPGFNEPYEIRMYTPPLTNSLDLDTIPEGKPMTPNQQNSQYVYSDNGNGMVSSIQQPSQNPTDFSDSEGENIVGTPLRHHLRPVPHRLLPQGLPTARLLPKPALSPLALRPPLLGPLGGRSPLLNPLYLNRARLYPNPLGIGSPMVGMPISDPKFTALPPIDYPFSALGNRVANLQQRSTDGQVSSGCVQIFSAAAPTNASRKNATAQADMWQYLVDAASPQDETVTQLNSKHQPRATAYDVANYVVGKAIGKENFLDNFRPDNPQGVVGSTLSHLQGDVTNNLQNALQSVNRQVSDAFDSIPLNYDYSSGAPLDSYQNRQNAYSQGYQDYQNAYNQGQYMNNPYYGQNGYNNQFTSPSRSFGSNYDAFNDAVSKYINRIVEYLRNVGIN